MIITLIIVIIIVCHYSKFFKYDEDLFGDHAVSCAGMVSIKHRHNLVRDTLLDVCLRSGISAGKEVDIGLRDRSVRSLRPADLLIYAWDGERMFVLI
ncbi:hypothetical protein OROGR_015466 [Orobanche gracilis]